MGFGGKGRWLFFLLIVISSWVRLSEVCFPCLAWRGEVRLVFALWVSRWLVSRLVVLVFVWFGFLLFCPLSSSVSDCSAPRKLVQTTHKTQFLVSIYFFSLKERWCSTIYFIPRTIKREAQMLSASFSVFFFLHIRRESGLFFSRLFLFLFLQRRRCQT